MTLEEKLKELIIYQYGNMVAFSKATNIPNTTIATIIKRGIHKAGISNIITICEALHISIDELAGGKIVPVSTESKNQRHLVSLEELLSYARLNSHEYKHLTIDGVPVTASEIESLLDSIEITINMIRRNRNKNDE